MPRVWWSLLVLMVVASCRSAEPAVVETATPWRQPGDVIDSILPMDTMLARFRVGTTAPVGLTGGASTSTALAQAIVSALASADTAALVGLLVTRAEYGWLVFPHHVYARPPYELDPGLAWLRLTSASSSGLTRLLREYGDHPMAMTSLSCAEDTTAVVRGGPVRIWGPCQVAWRGADGVEHSGRLFGSMLERDGRLKLLSYKSDL